MLPLLYVSVVDGHVDVVFGQNPAPTWWRHSEFGIVDRCIPSLISRLHAGLFTSRWTYDACPREGRSFDIWQVMHLHPDTA